MPPIPIRDLARGGVLLDVHPTSYPLPGFSRGRNVVFNSGKANTAPIWRTVASGVGAGARFCAGMSPASGYDKVVVARDDGSLASWSSGTITDVSETGWVSSVDTTSPWTSCALGDVLYINRQDQVPRCWLPANTRFTTMAAWDPTWRCRALRQFNSALLALNVTKGAVSTPSMVKVSDITLYGASPISWDSSDPTTAAYENPLAELDGPIIDGAALGDRFLFYTSSQIWEMRLGGPFDYQFRRVSSSFGAIGTNCIVEVGGLHYVFGSTDIFVTDGVTARSIAAGRVRDTLFRVMNISLAGRNFVTYDQATNDVLFCHVSGDSDAAWVTPTGCNAAMAYNIGTDTWAPRDLPNVSAVTHANLNSYLTYSTCGSRTFDGVGGSYYDQGDTQEIHTVAVAAPLSTPGSLSTITGGGLILSLDARDTGQAAYEENRECTSPSYVERTGIALDFPHEGGAPLVISKEVRAIYPEVSVSRGGSIMITVGGQMTTSGPVSWESPQEFNPASDYKIDSRATGRFLAIRLDFSNSGETAASGFDLDVIQNGAL